MDETLCTPTPVTASHIQEMIAHLSTTADGEPLRNAMDSLKLALKENPAACELLQPEDIGEMSKAIMKLEGLMILNAKVRKEVKESRKGKGKSAVSLDPSELEAMADQM
jgi:hypothetical protein